MANDSQDSRLSTAANIIGLLTFALSALNLVIVRILQNERRVIQQFGKREWINSYKALERKACYIQLFHPAFAGFKGNNIRPVHASADTSIPEAKSKVDGTPPEEGLQEILRDVQTCYDQAKAIVSEIETVLHLLSEQISVAGYAKATIRSILRLDLASLREVSAVVWRQLYSWRESRENVGTLEENYQKLSSIVAEVDSVILIVQGAKLIQLQSTIDRQANTIAAIVNTVKTRAPTELTPKEPTPSEPSS